MYAINPDDAALAFFILITLITIPSVRRIFKAGWSKKNPHYGDTIYEDEDGIANKESMASFTNTPQFIVIFVITCVGLGLSIADMVYTALELVKFKNLAGSTPVLGIWLLIPSWTFLLVQFLDAVREHDPVGRFYATVYKLWTVVFMIVIGAMALMGSNHSTYQNGLDFISSLLTGLQVLTLVALWAAVFSVQRRPTVYRPGGRIIDRYKSVSLWSRYFFYWANDKLDAAASETFGAPDMPAMDHTVRSEMATKDFNNIALKDNIPLWIQLFWAHRASFIIQWLSILLSNFFDVAPAFATLQLLKYLEARADINHVDPMAWKYVIGIIIATVSSHLIDSRIGWWRMTRLVVPVRATLTGIMYAKMLRIKNSSEPPKEEKEGSSQGDKPQSRSDIVNMFAVDANQIALFAAQNTEYVNFAGKFIVSVAFLLVLIGWQSLLAGLVGIFLLFPINKSLAARYGGKQKMLMKIRDKRTKLTTEALNGIRQIKFSAIEEQWAEKLLVVREEELSTLWSARLNNIYMSIASELTPVVLTALSLATYSLIHGNLLPSVAFTSISLFLQIDGLVSHIPYLLVGAINAKVASDRIEKFLHSPEKGINTHPGESVTFHDASVTWSKASEDLAEHRFTLRDLNLQFPNNALSVISGPTGSGKSLLLNAILGEVDVLSGYINVPKSPSSAQRFDDKATAVDWIIPTAIAFVSQTPWIENATIKNNIIFGLPFDAERYSKVLEACALVQDLSLFEDGDETEVGAQGISLSGGQKWRLTLARAMYSRAGILVMDDVFSALDAHVGKHIYDHGLMGDIAEGRTRILATHHVGLCLPRASYGVRLSAHGALEHAGSIEQLKQEGVLAEMLQADDTAKEDQVGEVEVLKASNVNGTAAIPSQDAAVAKAPPKKLIEEEKREKGRVKTSVYTGYLKASGGWPFWIFLIILFLFAESLTVGKNYWVKIWASSFGKSQHLRLSAYLHQSSDPTRYLDTARFHYDVANNDSQLLSTAQIDMHSKNLWFYLGVYCIISIVSVVFSVCRVYNIYAGGLRASRRIFQDMLHSVLRAPLRWLDTTPTGRILNRFTGDFTNMDSGLAQSFYYFFGCVWEMLGIMGAAVFVSPFMILFAILLLGTCSLFARRYLAAARTVKRLESTSKSPVISHFAASLDGLSTIRAFSKTTEFQSRMYNLIDSWTTCNWHNSLFRNWLMIRIGITASLFSAAVATFVVTTRGIDASLAGFALSFALSFGHTVSWAINISTQVELDMNAAERIFEYRDLTTEKQDGANVRASWPEQGKVEVKDLVVGYAEGLPSILKGLTFTAERNQRIGVVGRTGAGKSTLSLAIFRFLQIRSGSITIDGVDISKIRLHDLRSRLSIIPQDPVLFSGTIRSNLDPFDQFSDHQIRSALMRVHLIPSETPTPLPEPTNQSSSTSVTAVEPGISSPSVSPSNANVFHSLSHPIASGGSNLSQGQKQLLCLARAILSRPKILILDEATSAVDLETDQLIQRSIREEFSDTTLLVVAHRLSTVADFDRILVMKDGITGEFGSPKELLRGKDEDGIFKGMVENSGEKEELQKMILGEQSLM